MQSVFTMSGYLLSGRNVHVKRLVVKLLG